MKRLGLSVLVVAVVIGAGTYLWNLPRYSATDLKLNHDYYERLIKAHGAKAAYAEFKKRTVSLPPERQHVAAHVIGALIGEAEGANGVTICDSTFSFGCYHGLFTTIVAREGAQVIPELDAACIKAFGPLGTGCQHGIGHGILEYTGYEQLNDALALCKETIEKVPLLGCSSGVFMEYNDPLMGDPDKLAPSIRTFDAAHPYVPCTSVSQRYQPSCFFELGGWLDRTQGGAAKLCSALSGEQRKNCFLGMGARIGQETQLEVSKMREACANANPGDENVCRAGVRWSLWADPAQRSRASEACADPNKDHAETCESLGDLTRGTYPS